MSESVPSAPASRRVSLTVDGHQFGQWQSASVDRDLRNISGQFTLQLFDSGRAAQAFRPNLDQGPPFEIIKAGMSCAVALDGETVLKGYIDDIHVAWAAHGIRVSGRDATGDLVDCAASPTGPVEWRNLTLTQLAAAFCKPFGIAVRADVDVGTAFPVFGIEAGETAMLAIERAARQRGVLVVSDGVGGLLLTRGGATRAPGALTIPGNIVGAHYTSSWRQRFSDYYVKGQTSTQQARYGGVCRLTPLLDPVNAPVGPPPASATPAETVSVAMTGHVSDPEITRYRPTVRGVRTQSGSSSVQAQAEWALRVARGMGEQAHYTVADWRANGALWLPNALVSVSDPYAGIDKDMLIASVSYRQSAQGASAVIGVAGRTAFDRIDEPASDRKFIFKRAPKSFGPTRQG
ncbi:MAG: phage baseplate assembly protein [Acidiphilium sp.]